MELVKEGESIPFNEKIGCQKRRKLMSSPKEDKGYNLCLWKVLLGVQKAIKSNFWKNTRSTPGDFKRITRTYFKELVQQKGWTSDSQWKLLIRKTNAHILFLFVYAERNDQKSMREWITGIANKS